MDQDIRAASLPAGEELSESRGAVAAEDNDLAILNDVEHAIANDEVLRRIDLPTLRIQVHSGVVLLQGHVATRPHREQIEEIVRKARGVQDVRNQVVADDYLELAVAQALGSDSRTRSAFFRVASTRGIVRLSTRLSRADSFKAAEEVASRVPGVRAVVIVDPESREDLSVLLPPIGTTIYCRDGQLGKLRRVVLSRSSRLVIQLIVAARLHPSVAKDLYGDASPEEHHLVVPLTYVDRVVPSGIFLGLSIAEADRLQRFNPENFDEPEPTWQASIDYRAEDVYFPKGR